MDEQLVQKVADAVFRKLSEKPRAFCIGTPPEDLPFTPISQPPYDAVVLASLTPAQLLQMPNDPVCHALLEGKPVYLLPEGLEHRKYAATGAKHLYSLLLAKERQLYTMGVQKLPTGGTGRLLTAQDARRRKEQGLPLPPGVRLTPLAKDIWEGKA